MKSGHSPWAKKEQASKDIDLRTLFDDYWTSEMRELTVPGQSCPHPTNFATCLMEKRRGRCRWKA